MRFQFIDQHRGEFRVVSMCRVLEVSSSGYYAWRKRPESARSREDRHLEAQIRVIHSENYKIYGSPKIHRELRAQGIRVARKRVARLMRACGLRSRRRRKFRGTTQSQHRHPIAPNRLERCFEVEAANRVWLGDITCIWTREGWLYLAAILDLYSRRIVGWATSSRITGELTLEALRRALWQRQPASGLLHHSDRGSQYAAGDYRHQLQAADILLSMSRRGNCWDNAPMESFFASLKSEWVAHAVYLTREAARRHLFEYIEVFYNRRRRHASIDYVNPAEFESLNHATRSQNSETHEVAGGR